MTDQYPWRFEECSPEGARDPAGQPWAHAVRGRKPQRPMVMGYGHHPDDAERDATHKAHQADAREVLGIPHEAIVTWSIIGPDGRMIIEHLEEYFTPLTFRLTDVPIEDFMDDPYMSRKLNEVYGWPIMMPIGT